MVVVLIAIAMITTFEKNIFCFFDGIFYVDDRQTLSMSGNHKVSSLDHSLFYSIVSKIAIV